MCAKCTKCTKCAKYTNVCKMCKVYNVCKVRKVYRCVQNVQSIPMCTQYHCHISQQWEDQWHQYSRPYCELISTYSALQPNHIFLSVWQFSSFPLFFLLLLMSSQWSGANGKGPETYFYRKRVIVCGVHMCTCGKKFSIVVFREDVLDVWPHNQFIVWLVCGIWPLMWSVVIQNIWFEIFMRANGPFK